MKQKTLHLLLIYFGIGFASTAHGASSWSTDVETGFGYDSNPYRAPGQSYFDYAAGQNVDPTINGSAFIPVDLEVEYDSGHESHTLAFLASYDYSADLYLGSNADNANRYGQKLTAGMSILVNREGNDEDIVTLLPYFRSYDKTYYDRDTGDAKVSSVTNTDLSDRYSYEASGVDIEFEQESASFPYQLEFEMAHYDYVDPASQNFDAYDHDYLRIGAEVDFPLASTSRLTASYDNYTRNYSERRARDLSANYVTQARKYTYNNIGLTLRQELGDLWRIYLDYDLTDRKDANVGYYDYQQNAYGMRVIYDDDARIKIRGQYEIWDRNYDNAFAFYDPTQPKMTYDVAEASLQGEYSLGSGHQLWAEYSSWAYDSTDLRYKYDRYQAMFGWRWET